MPCSSVEGDKDKTSQVAIDFCLVAFSELIPPKRACQKGGNFVAGQMTLAGTCLGR